MILSAAIFILLFYLWSGCIFRIIIKSWFLFLNSILGPVPLEDLQEKKIPKKTYVLKRMKKNHIFCFKFLRRWSSECGKFNAILSYQCNVLLCNANVTRRSSKAFGPSLYIYGVYICNCIFLFLYITDCTMCIYICEVSKINSFNS